MLAIACLGLVRMGIPELIKAIVLIGPMTTAFIAVMLALYQEPVWATTAACALAGICVGLFYRYRKTWTYVYATVAALLAALAHAWPTP